MVLPWKAFIVEIKADFFVYIFASFIAHSLASVPLAQKNEYFRSQGVISARSFASTQRSGSMSSCDGIGLCRSWACTVSTTSGWDQPWEKSPYPPSQSIYFRPITSSKIAHFPCHSVAAHMPHLVTDFRLSSHHLLKCSLKFSSDSEMIHSASSVSGRFLCLIIPVHFFAYSSALVWFCDIKWKIPR